MKQLTGSQGSSEPAAVTTVVNGDTPSERELRSHIPAEIRPSCGPPINPEETAVAAFNCSYREVVKLQYNLFASDLELRRDVARVRKLYGDKHECGTKPLLCFEQSSGEADIVWIDAPANIMGFAYRDDGHLDALYESWRKIAECREQPAIRAFVILQACATSRPRAANARPTNRSQHRNRRPAFASPGTTCRPSF